MSLATVPVHKTKEKSKSDDEWSMVTITVLTLSYFSTMWQKVQLWLFFHCKHHRMWHTKPVKTGRNQSKANLCEQKPMEFKIKPYKSSHSVIISRLLTYIYLFTEIQKNIESTTSRLLELLDCFWTSGHWEPKA